MNKIIDMYLIGVAIACTTLLTIVYPIAIFSPETGIATKILLVSTAPMVPIIWITIWDMLNFLKK